MRTFIAIEIPGSLLADLDGELDTIRSGPEGRLVRWVRPEAMHLTLKFLGEIDQQQVFAIQGILNEVAQSRSRFELQISGLGCFPNTRRPRVVWVGFDPLVEDLIQLQIELEHRLEKIGIEAERREYHPHLTIGRIRRGLSGSEQRTISDWAQRIQLGSIGTFEVKAITLIRSDLKPSGAIYTHLHSAGLTS